MSNAKIDYTKIEGLPQNATLRTTSNGQIIGYTQPFNALGYEAVDDNVANVEVTNYFQKATSDPSSTIERFSNQGDFIDGDYFTRITQIGSVQGQGILIPIPEQMRVVGKNIRIYIRYKSSVNVPVSAYLKNGGTFINNGGRTQKTLTASSQEAEFFIDRDYEAGANLFNVYFDTNVQAVVDFATVYTMSEGISPKTPITTTVEIDNNGTDSYNLIQNTIRNYTSPVIDGELHVEFIVKDSAGIYFENDIRGLTSYRGSKRGVVVLRAETPLGATIKSDGNSTNENYRTPADYYFAGEEGKLMADVPTHKKHAFWLHESMDVKDFIIHDVDCKYCVHQDTHGQFDSLFEGNYFIHEKINDLREWRVIGLGTRFNQKARYYNNIGEFRNNTGNVTGFGNIPMMFFWHNDNNETAPTLLECINNKAINCGIGLFSEIGSNQPDEVVLKGNTTNLPTAGIELQNHELNTSFGYNINYKIEGDVNYFKLRERASGREDLRKTSLPINSYLFQFKNTSGNILEQGIAVKRDYVNNTFVKATDSNFDAVIWRDAGNGSEGYFIPKGKTADVLCVAGNYAVGDEVSINVQGKFFESAANAVGVVVKAVAPSTDSLVKILLF